MTVCSLRSQISLASKNRAPIHHYASTKFLRPGQSLIFSPRHEHCVAFCGKFFWKCLVLGAIWRALRNLDASVLRGERDNFIYANPLDNSKHRSRANSRLSEGRKGHVLSCNIDYRIPWLNPSMFPFTTQHVVIVPERTSDCPEEKLSKHPDNGRRDIRAMGYILVRWVSNNLVPVLARQKSMDFKTPIETGRNCRN